MTLRIGLTYDLKSDYLAMGFSSEAAAEFDKEETVEGIEHALAEFGYAVDRIGHIRALTERLAAGDRWDLVFNIAEGVAGYAREAQVPALLEAYDIPYTGSDPLTLSVSHHKGFTKQVVAGAGVGTAPFALVTVSSDIDRVTMPFPLFVKPVSEGTGKGINAGSRVTSRDELISQCRYVLETFSQPALVETYLPGREFTAGVVGSAGRAHVIGAMEICSSDGAESHAYTFFNKENYESVIRYAPVTDSQLTKAIEDVCLPAWDALGGRDFCRMDLRADAAGRLSFIEVNALPGLNPLHSDLPIICRQQGIPYATLIGRVVDSARKRYRL